MPTDVGRNLAELVRPSAQQQQKQQQEQQAEELSNGKHEQAHPPLEAVGKQEEQQQQEQEGRASGALPARPALQQRSPAPGLPHTDAQRQHSGVRGVLGEPRGQDGHSMLSRRSVLGDLASRLSSLLPHHVDPQLQQQQYTDPMFCLELAVRFFYWAKYAYRHWVSWRTAGLAHPPACRLLHRPPSPGWPGRQPGGLAGAAWRVGGLGGCLASGAARGATGTRAAGLARPRPHPCAAPLPLGAAGSCGADGPRCGAAAVWLHRL